MTTPIDPENPKDIVGSRKPPLHLIPLTANIAAAMAFKDGAAKYGPYNWRAIKIKASPYVVAARRHIELWWDCSEEYAKDSGVHHLGHAMATLAILYDAMINDGLIDDRPIPSKASELMDHHTEKMPSPLKECSVVIADVEPDPAPWPSPDCKATDTVDDGPGYNPIDPSTWEGTNTWDNEPVPKIQTAHDLESGTFFVDDQEDVCQVLDEEKGNRRVVCLSVGLPYIRPVLASLVKVDRIITQEEATLLCT